MQPRHTMPFLLRGTLSRGDQSWLLSWCATPLGWLCHPAQTQTGRAWCCSWAGPVPWNQHRLEGALGSSSPVQEPSEQEGSQPLSPMELDWLQPVTQIYSQLEWKPTQKNPKISGLSMISLLSQALSVRWIKSTSLSALFLWVLQPGQAYRKQCHPLEDATWQAQDPEIIQHKS